MLEQKWIETISAAFKGELGTRHSMPCIYSTSEGIQRTFIYPKVVEEELKKTNLLPALTCMSYLNEKDLDSNFHIERFTLEGVLNGSSFRLDLTVLHPSKKWDLNGSLLSKTNDPLLVQKLSSLMQEFIEEYSPLRLHLLTEDYQQVEL